MRPSEVLEHLVRFVEDPEVVATMTPEEVRAELEAEGVDLTAARERLHTMMNRPFPLEPIPPTHAQVNRWCAVLQRNRDWLSCGESGISHAEAVELTDALADVLRHIGVS